MLTLAATAQPDYIALALVAVLVVMLVVMVIRKHFAIKRAAQAKKMKATSAAEPAQEVSAPTAPGSAGQVKLYNVEPKTAAMLMAIVANQMGKPLNELHFVSIKEVK